MSSTIGLQSKHYFIIFLLFMSHCLADLTQETIYLTWQRNPSTTMTIQWISLKQDSPSQVSYRLKKEGSNFIKIQDEVIPFPRASKYFIYRVELQNLLPDTEKEYQFITAPLSLTKEFQFVVGGDMYHDGIQFMEKTCRQAAQTNPLFALIGGDIAYAVKSRYLPIQKTERWIEWVKARHANMITSNGRLIPVIAAVGNHDVTGQYDQTPAQAAAFSALFPMPGKQIYNALDFGSYLSIFILDSGHANPIIGRQANWLQSALEMRQHMTHRFAIYHVPAYPSGRHFQNKQSIAIRYAWVPIFEKKGIQAVFEHHDHIYKRTYPLLRNRIHAQGIVYIGDGGWGVEKLRSPRSTRPYLAKVASVRHFIAVTLTPLQQHFKCISDEGIIIDEYLQPTNRRSLTKELELTPS